MKQVQVQGLKLFLFLALALVLNIFLVKKEHEASTRNVFELFFFYQSSRSKFVHGFAKMADAEASLKKVF